MLILTRNVTETIVIGDDITITVLGTQGHRVRLGINAPNDISVHREEVYNKIKNEANKTMMEDDDDFEPI